MTKYSKARHIWRAIYPMLIFIGLSTVIVFIAVLGYSFAIGIDMAATGETLEQAAIEEMLETFIMNYGLWFQFFSSIIGILIFSLIWRKTRYELKKYDNNRLRPLLVCLTIFFWVGLNFVLASVFALADIVRFFPSYEDVIKVLESGNLVVRILTIGIAAPIMEELCCRGIVFNRLNSWLPAWAAVVISSALFGLVHLNIFQGLYAFLLGVLLCMMYVRYRNLWVPVIAHIVFNVANVLLGSIPGVEETNTLFILFPGLLITIVCAILLLKRTTAAALIVESESNISTESMTMS